jgi:dUTP pyrophosphatase
MNVVAKFQKVSFEQFLQDYLRQFPDDDIDQIKEQFDLIKLPKRSTIGSAGYDFYIPNNVTVCTGESVIIPTGIRCKIEDGWFLGIVPRSSLGFKYHVALANTIGIIDSSYYVADNEGHIMIKIVNNGCNNLYLCEGDRFAQGIFIPYGITEDDDVSEIRTGGFGSTGI